ncbi:hypothetical protein BDA99DRAFT_58099 [Phascolomyces articulosus]|uniref:UBA domain-containing protein n=1 Tax=Phascolomyces articulosus TaxID=60185 RepID=A0AAD5K052_9FUNG|nr:hypothetical protein BDA99DRAFT_58099 [Phascolomyces articulosus]
MIEIHGSADDEMPTEARVAGSQASANAAISSSSSGTSSEPASQQQQQQQQSQQQQEQPKQQESKYPEEHIKLLTNLGVSRQEAINALDMASGNPDLAASLLFQN